MNSMVVFDNDIFSSTIKHFFTKKDYKMASFNNSTINRLNLLGMIKISLE